MAAPRHPVRVGPRFPVRVNMADPYNGAPDNIALAWNLFQPDPIVGPEPVFSVASANYDENGNNIGNTPRIDAGKGLWMGGQVANLLPAGMEDFRHSSWVKRGVTPTLNADGSYRITLGARTSKDIYSTKPSTNLHTLTVWARLVSGTSKLVFADASTETGRIAFSLSSGFTLLNVSFAVDGQAHHFYSENGTDLTVDLKMPMATNAAYQLPYVPPGATQLTNAATTGGNGVNIPLDAGLLECFQGKTDGVELCANLDGFTNHSGTGTTTHTSLSFTTTSIGTAGILFGPLPVGNRYLVQINGTTTSSEFSANSANAPSPSTRTHFGVFGVFEWAVASGMQYLYLRHSNAGTTTLSSISIQRLLPAVCSTVDRFCFGFSSAQISADTALRSVRNATTDVLYVSTGGVIKSSDGTNTATVTVAGGWPADQIISLYRRSTGTQMQVGYRKSGETAITWGALVSYDGSDNPGTHERCCLNGTLPIWGQAKSTANKYCTDSELLEMEALAA